MDFAAMLARAKSERASAAAAAAAAAAPTTAHSASRVDRVAYQEQAFGPLASAARFCERRHAVCREPPGLWYVPDFVSEEDERRLLEAVDAQGAPWVQLRHRRLQNFGGTAGGELGPLPPFCERLAACLVENGVFSASEAPNHVLVNDYAPGQGIMAHEDGPAYRPRVAILSLASRVVFRFRPKCREPLAEEVGPTLVLPPRSLLVFEGAFYTDMLHEVAEARTDVVHASCANLAAASVAVGDTWERRRRVSLTVRRALARQSAS